MKFHIVMFIFFGAALAQSCTSGYSRCTSNTTYQTCANGAFQVNQSCPKDLVCTPAGNFIYCVSPSQTTSTSGATTGSVCTDNTARCTSSTTYEVCTAGSYGANQTCQDGLVCSSTGTNAFCVRPSEVTTGVSVPCTNDAIRCTSSTTYQVCTGGTFGANQTCQDGLVCSPSGNTAFCVRPSEVTTGIQATSASNTAGSVTSGMQATTGSGCTEDTVRCTSSTTYRVCTGGSFGANQTCQDGLVCSPSGNTAFCVRPSEVTTGMSVSCTANSIRCSSNTTYQICFNGFYGSDQSCQKDLVCAPSGNTAYCVRPSEATSTSS